MTGRPRNSPLFPYPPLSLSAARSDFGLPAAPLPVTGAVAPPFTPIAVKWGLRIPAVNSVLVVGGGLAGTATAIHLAKAGVAVDLVDIKPDVAALGSGITLQRSEEHTSELQSRQYLVCRLLLEKKKNSQ